MTKKQIFGYSAIVALITNVALIPVYKKRWEEEKREEEELMKKVDEMGREMIRGMADESFRKWQEKQQRES